MLWSRSSQRRTRRVLSTAWMVAAACGLVSCSAPPLGTPAPTVDQETQFEVAQTLRNKVDILFMVDNSGSMQPMITELQARFGEFLAVFENLRAQGTYADIHLGVVTSDYGAGSVDNTAGGGCARSPGGQLGQLQAKGDSADTSCEVPLGNKPYIEYTFSPDISTDASNLPTGQSLLQTFTCMASVGANGCGYEHQLESVYAALRGIGPAGPTNQGFLRDDAFLAVVFVTNEDDCSAPPGTLLFDPDPARVSQFGYFGSYRCTRFGLTCNGQLPPYDSSGGMLADCSPGGLSSGGQLWDVSRYIDFFSKRRSEGGIKENPGDVILVAIDAPATPFETLLSNPRTTPGDPYVSCSPLSQANQCLPVLQYSCQNESNPVFFGAPSIRLNAVINSVSAVQRNISSICADDYTPALQNLGNLIVSKIASGCIAAKLPNPTAPECIVEDVTTTGTQTTVTRIPRCESTSSALPCWRIEPKPSCNGLSPDGVGLTIERGGQAPPTGTKALIKCRTTP